MTSLPTQQHELIELKNLMPLSPWNSQPQPLRKLKERQYVKLKKPILRDGVIVYWQPKIVEKEAEDLEFEYPYVGLFEFIDRYIVDVIKRWTDKLLGPILSIKFH
ncbi:hypothetical protein RIF29_13507 [Crotalaria pallida]|uniref:Uncharacterized protein n=1 Tax=Crotalaria pallida TaxID=3830 RepID=A0AAN9P2X5_CROPI